MSRIGDEVYGNDRLAVAAMHDVNLAATYCSHVLMLFGQGEWEAGTALDMLSVERLQRMYRCPVESVDTPAGRRFHPAFDRASA
jgi:iron complex transport system ATP-binding protein